MFGENWRPAGEIFPWLLLSQGLMAAMPQPEQVLIPHGKVATIFRLRAICAVVSISTAIYGASMGLEAFAMSRVVAASFFLAATFIPLPPYLAFPPRRFTR